jgi:exodeoxyribonuclease-3
LRIVTYNVNSLRARETRVLDWLDRTKPDVVLLQELKLEDDKYPHMTFQAMGYTSAVYGQKTYNGVAILSRTPITDVVRGMSEGADDAQARVIAARTADLFVVSAYVPNGESIGSEKFRYKLDFYDRLARWLEARLVRGEPIVIGGDFNVAPDDLDCHNPLQWRRSIMFSSDERSAFKRLVDLGLVDVVRERNPETQLFSWWDYRVGSFAKNRGLRIDHILAAPSVAARATAAGVDVDMRDGKAPSDHAPVWVDLDG